MNAINNVSTAIVAPGLKSSLSIASLPPILLVFVSVFIYVRLLYIA